MGGRLSSDVYVRKLGVGRGSGRPLGGSLTRPASSWVSLGCGSDSWLCRADRWGHYGGSAGDRTNRPVCGTGEHALVDIIHLKMYGLTITVIKILKTCCEGIITSKKCHITAFYTTANSLGSSFHGFDMRLKFMFCLKLS